MRLSEWRSAANRRLYRHERGATVSVDAVFEEAFERLGGERACEQEPLGEVASLSLQLASLAVVLDALGKRLQAQRLTELDQRVRQGVRLARNLQPGDEG